jgi:hypothetical protein
MSSYRSQRARAGFRNPTCARRCALPHGPVPPVCSPCCAVDTVSVGADAQLAYIGGRRSQDRLPLLTDPLEGGEGSYCRVGGGHADDDPMGGLVGGGSQGPPPRAQRAAGSGVPTQVAPVSWAVAGCGHQSDRPQVRGRRDRSRGACASTCHMTTKCQAQHRVSIWRRPQHDDRIVIAAAHDHVDNGCSASLRPAPTPSLTRGAAGGQQCRRRRLVSRS